MRALVTGGAGFVGSHLAAALVDRGDTVTVFDQRDAYRAGSVSVVGDLLTDDLDHVIGHDGVDIVYHFAANASVRGGTDNPSLDLEQNLIGTSRLLEWMRHTGTKRIVFASSSSVYGLNPPTPTPETCPFPEQTSFYGASKVAAEALISAYCHGFGMQATVFRFVPMLGEGYRRGFVYDFWRKLIEDQDTIEVLGDGKQRKAYVYVGDAIAAILAGTMIPRDGFHVYNVSGADTASVDEALDWMCQALRINPQRTYTGASWAGDKPITLLDAGRIRALGWTPKTPIKEAVVRTLHSFYE